MTTLTHHARGREGFDVIFMRGAFASVVALLVTGSSGFAPPRAALQRGCTARACRSGPCRAAEGDDANESGDEILGELRKALSEMDAESLSDISATSINSYVDERKGQFTGVTEDLSRSLESMQESMEERKPFCLAQPLFVLHGRRLGAWK